MPSDDSVAHSLLSYNGLTVAYGEARRQAASLQGEVDLLRARGDLWKARAEDAERRTGDDAQTRAALETTIVTLRESAEFENEKVRSLSAQVEELKRMLAEAGEHAMSLDDTLHAERADHLAAAKASVENTRWLAACHEREVTAAVLREREECAQLCEQIGADLEEGGANNGYGESYADAIRARSK